MALYQARDAAIYISTTAEGTAAPLLTMTAWTLDMTASRIDVTNFDSPNQEEMTGWPARRGTFEGFWNSSEDKLFAAANSPNGVKMYLYPTRRVPSKYASGTAWLDASMEARVDGVNQVRGTFSAAGGIFTVNL